MAHAWVLVGMQEAALNEAHRAQAHIDGKADRVADTAEASSTVGQELDPTRRALKGPIWHYVCDTPVAKAQLEDGLGEAVWRGHHIRPKAPCRSCSLRRECGSLLACDLIAWQLNM